MLKSIVKQQFNNTFISDLSPHPKHKVEVEVGDIKQPDKFYPHIKFKHWDNEVNFSVRLKHEGNEESTVTTQGNKIVWSKGDVEAHIYHTKYNRFDGYRDADLGMLTAEYVDEDIELVTEPYEHILSHGRYQASDYPGERLLRKEAAEQAFGDVLVVGLGLGVINEYLKKNPRVTSITVVEFSKKIIALMQSIHPDRIEGIQLIISDYFTYCKETDQRFDYIYGDIFSQSGVQYIKKWERFITTAQTLLKSGGKINSRAHRLFENFDKTKLDEDSTEFEIVLQKKPLSNVIEYTLQSKGLDFYYQPELTAEQIAQGDFRPIDTIGSYAVYMSNPKINIEGQNLYRTGKVGHIYRPKIVDANGISVWGELYVNKDEGVMRVTIPQDFLDNATYPIYHASGATFGYTTAGSAGSTSTFNVIVGSNFAGVAGTGTSVTASITADETISYKMNVYVQSTLNALANGPTNQGSDSTSSQHFATQNFTATPTFTAVNYIITLWSNAAYKSGLVLFFDAGTTNQGYTLSSTYAGSWPSLSGASNNNNMYSIYVTYTPSTPTFFGFSSTVSQPYFTPYDINEQTFLGYALMHLLFPPAQAVFAGAKAQQPINAIGITLI